MNDIFNIYIDESGTFERDKDCSIVAGFVTRNSIEELDAAVSKTVDEVNNELGTDFTKADIHLAPLLHPEEAAFKEEEKKRFMAISNSNRTYFANSLLETLKKNTDFLFFSINEHFTFGTGGAQDRYGANLLAAISSAVEEINTRCEKTKQCVFFAPRASKCLPGNVNYSRYHDDLCTSMVDCFPNTSFSYANRYKSGYDLADVACYFIRNGLGSNLLSPLKIIKTSPSMIYRNRYKEARVNVLTRLLSNRQYNSALQWALSSNDDNAFQKVLSSLESETDLSKQAHEMEGLLNLAYEQIEQRTAKVNSLSTAFKIIKYVYKISDLRIQVSSLSDGSWLNLKLDAINAAITCANHQGLKDKQLDLKKQFDALIHNHGELLGNVYIRKERTLSLRNRAYNVDFNDYRFQGIIDNFKEVVEQRVKNMEADGEKKDDLTGEICGTIGQAHAFLARTEPEKNYQEAEVWLKKSLGYFRVGHKYHSMSVNFLTALAWDQKKYQEALIAFSGHQFIESKDGTFPSDIEEMNRLIETWLEKLISTRASNPGTPFDIVALLRILAELTPVPNSKTVQKISFYVKNINSDAHPYELLAKWLGVIEMRRGNIDKSKDWLNTSIGTSSNMGFTVKTVALSSRGLLTTIPERAAGGFDALDGIVSLKIALDELRKKSQSFSEYIESVGSENKLKRDVEKKDLIAICRWMPFSYC